MTQVMVIDGLPVGNRAGITPARKAKLVAERTCRASRRVILWGERGVRPIREFSQLLGRHTSFIIKV